MTSDRVLVPIAESVTLRQTVGHAVQSTLSGADTAEIHFVVAMTYGSDPPGGERVIADTEALLDRVTTWAREDAGEVNDERLTIETAIVGTDAYLFSPRDYADQLARYAHERDIERLILDPEYRPGSTAPMLRPLEKRLDHRGLSYEEAPVDPTTRRTGIVTAGSASRYVALFSISYLFYLLLGDPTYTFDLLTGAITGAIVAVSLGHVTFSTPPHPLRSATKLVRLAVYVPYLLWEIVKANVAISLVILRPSMPIEPRLTRVRASVWDGLALTTLANSITLTPGTLTVRANDQNLIIHTLIPDAREGLFDGGLERAVRFIFYGREAARIASPRERGEAEIIDGDAGTDSDGRRSTVGGDGS